MKLKTILIATLLAVNAVYAVSEVSRSEPQLSEQALSGRPYSNSTNYDTSLPDLGDVSQTVFTLQDLSLIHISLPPSATEIIGAVAA